MGNINSNLAVDEENTQRRVVTGPPVTSACILEDELNWFFKVLDGRIKLHFGHDFDHDDIFDIMPPGLDGGESVYGYFITHYNMTFAERVVFILSLVPHIKPQLLDLFFTKNAANSRVFTEFGGRNDQSLNAFVPTGETALFILAGDDLEKRLTFSRLFEADHFFAKHDILKLSGNLAHEPELSGTLTLSREVIDLTTTGTIRKPIFSAGFPAKKIETGLDWSDLVLDHYTMERVLEIRAWIEYGHILLDELDLRRKIKPGYRCLFYGPPGTGKTFTASLLGKATGLEVYCIDLSMVVSKYIGETEKNLEKVFSKAEHKNWVLFFDEADALFGKRTNINDAHDRFANQEVSYLLQRVEDYEGVVILASNLKSNIDEAFSRRFQSIIHFPMPGQKERSLLWNNAFPEKINFSDNVNLSQIAADYELSGGAIMNVVRYAALMMLKGNKGAVFLSDIKEGIRKELQKEGKTS
ncbi:MAG: ATP-binding protein [Deltaproteobacteria bacterium]|nr:ATP-binding protein [Deltaproteobacteria bacterium]